MSNKHYVYVYSINQDEVWREEYTHYFTPVQWWDVKLTNGNKPCSDSVGNQLRVIIPSRNKYGHCHK